MRAPCLVRLASILAAALSVHCTDAADVGVNEAEATSGAPVHGNEPYFWADTSFADFLATARQPSQRASDYAFDGSDRIAARLQAWADRIHAEVESDVRRTTGEPLVAPKPKIVVVQGKERNAWVTGVNACLLEDADLSKIGAPARP